MDLPYFEDEILLGGLETPEHLHQPGGDCPARIE